MHEWFRSPDWSSEAQQEFEQRLRRARVGSRPQYLRIKGLALADAGETEGARELWLRVLESTDELAWLDKSGALERLGDSYAAENPALAEHYYRRLLAEYPTLNGTTATQHVKLAELLLDRGSEHDLDEAAELLVRWAREADLPFPNAQFRWQLAAIRVAEAKGDRHSARQAARTALDLAARGPAFPRHRTVGLVLADEPTLNRLRELAQGPMTAAEVLAEQAGRLRDDPAYRVEVERAEAAHVHRVDEQPLLNDLAAIGIHVDTVWDLYKLPDSRESAIPVLLEHIDRNYPDRVLEGIGAGLDHKSVRAWWDEMKVLYLSTEHQVVRDRLAAVMSGYATRDNYSDLIAFLGNPSLGETRIYFLRPINRIGNRLKPGQGRSVIEAVAGDPSFTGEAFAILKGRSRNQ